VLDPSLYILGIGSVSYFVNMVGFIANDARMYEGTGGGQISFYTILAWLMSVAFESVFISSQMRFEIIIAIVWPPDTDLVTEARRGEIEIQIDVQLV